MALAPACKYKDAVCTYCKKPGHLEKVCIAKKKALGSSSAQASAKLGHMQKNMYMEHEGTAPEYDMFALQDQSNEPTQLEIFLNELLVSMIMDTGASLLIISQATFDRLRQHDSSATLNPSSVCLRTYTGERFLSWVLHSCQSGMKPLWLTYLYRWFAGDGPDLAGRDWLGRLNASGGQVHSLEHDHDQLTKLIDKHSMVFDGSLGCLKDTKVTLHVNDKVKPKFLKPRPVPFLLREKVEKELDRLQSLGIITPVQQSEWAAPIVPVPKQDGTVRLCGDFKTTINQASTTETYPLPQIEELFADLSGGKYFTCLMLIYNYR